MVILLLQFHMKQCKNVSEWVDNYKNQPELIYGNTQYQYSYIAEQYPNRIEWDIEKLLMVTIDIEVACENGFPNPEDAIETSYYQSQSKIIRQRD